MQESLMLRLETLLNRVENWLPPEPETLQWQYIHAGRWRRGYWHGYIQSVPQPHYILPDDLLGIERQRTSLELNTRQFLRGLPANNALLWGAKGTGKSSLIKALLNRYAGEGLRLVQVEKTDLSDLPEIIEVVRDVPQHFILFCDDLSFAAEDAGYPALKSLLDGSVGATPENVLIYATSNRRHLLPEYRHENLDARNLDGEIHPGEAVEEKVSLSERFGLWLSFYPFKQEEYLQIVEHWVDRLGGDPKHPQLHPQALQWALARGSRSGRAAWQFSRAWVGQQSMEIS